MDIKITRERRIYFSFFATPCCDLFHQNTCPHTYRQPPHNKQRSTHHRYRRQGYDVVSGAALGVLVPGLPSRAGSSAGPS